jgi:hypothetical protein
VITLLKIRPYTGDVVVPSPNHGARKAEAIEGIVLHATADAGDEARSRSRMRSQKSRTSSHLQVSRSGRVTRLVGDQQRALHANATRWRGRRDVNSITLGIEIANRNDGEPYTDAQYRRVADIVAHYCRQGISLDHVVSRGELASGRRADPLGWDWDHFRALVQDQLRPVEEPPARAPEPGGEAVPGVETVVRRIVAPPMQRVPVFGTPKSATRSRTVWLNGLTVLAAGSVILADTFELAYWVGINVPEDVVEWALLSLGAANIVLRFRTTRPLGRVQSAPAPGP